MHFQLIENTEQSPGFEGHVSAVTMLSNETPAPAVEDPLDDVFGSDSPEQESRGDPQTSHPSDMRRLEKEHTTAGYREGLTAAKATSVQAGFDEGFGLGACIGQEVGHILGVMEGISEALRSASHQEAAAAEDLLARAQKGLEMGTIYSPEYWAGDGNWTFDVEPKEEGGEVLFEDVAKQHPVIKEWLLTLEKTQMKWGINTRILEDEGGQRHEIGSEELKPSVNTDANNKVAAKQALDW